VKARDPETSRWRIIARGYFSDFVSLVDTANRPGDFLAGLLAALPADMAADKATLYLNHLDSFVGSILSQDIDFFTRRGVRKGICELRDRLTKQASHPPSPQAIAQAAAMVDSFAQRFLDDTENTREALTWLKASEKRNTVGELANTAASIRLVNSLYKAGATKVWAVEIDRYPGGTENTGKLVIELSSLPKARAEVLRLASRKSEAKGFGNINDGGQRYVFLMLD